MSEKKQVQSVREARTYNQAAETVHAGLGRISSRIRLSLSLRIAGHYCGRLARTFLLAAVVMTQRSLAPQRRWNRLRKHRVQDPAHRSYAPPLQAPHTAPDEW